MFIVLMNAFVIKLLEYLLIVMLKRPQSKVRVKNQQHFPFSAYILKSYSTQHSQKNSPDEQAESRSIKNINQYLNILQLNSKLIQSSLPTATKVPLRQETPALRKHPQSQKLSLLQQSLEVPQPAPKMHHPRMKVKSLSPVKKRRAIENPKIIASLRYQLVSLFGLLGRRQDFMAALKGKSEQMMVPLKNSQIDQIFVKLEETKGRDKGRVKFNYIISQQLRSLKYKVRSQVTHSQSPSKKDRNNYDQEESVDEEEQEQKELCVDYNTWKRRNGVGYNQKVFIIKGGYAELRRSLLDRGWAENQDVWSPHYDFKWTTKIQDINFMALKHSQGVNHFNNNQHLTSKYGLTRRLRTLPLSHGIDSDKFYPRCYDLGDQVDFQNFIENFKNSFAQSIFKRFLVDKERYKGLELKVRVAFEVLKRRTQSFGMTTNNVNKGVFPVIMPEEWGILTETAELDQQIKQKKLMEIRKSQKTQFPLPQSQQQGYEQNIYVLIDEQMRKHLQLLENRDPQFDINGMRNTWIAKPNFLSRGRGIRCFNNIYDIVDYCMGVPTQFVVQKYIQNPLLIQGRKFDIRQWVLIQDFNPPKIWFYDECYLRFTNEQYSLDNIYNRFAHLTNNSIQKHSKKHSPDNSMWDSNQFRQWLGEQKWKLLQQKMRDIVVWSIKSCEGIVIGKKGSAELVGYDFMIDDKLNPWLIEVNMSPTMESSTPVTKRMVKNMLYDAGKLIGGGKKGNKVGGYTCIYRGNEDLEHFDIFNI